ncbi:MAG: BolA family transcriptional regulator [Betaproteobacteria bacterium]|nr:BolA family transcriptional regulator [Betaproteobacteria bacterium]
MNITAEQLHAQLAAQLTPFELQVFDESAAHAGHAGADGSGRGTHFRVRIGAGVFQGLSRLAKHRLVYDALHQFTDRGMHALAIEIVDRSS